MVAGYLSFVSSLSDLFCIPTCVDDQLGPHSTALPGDEAARRMSLRQRTDDQRGRELEGIVTRRGVGAGDREEVRAIDDVDGVDSDTGAGDTNDLGAVRECWKRHVAARTGQYRRFRL